jgi:hypothetical protein
MDHFLPHAPDRRRSDETPTVLVFDIFGTVHQVALDGPGGARRPESAATSEPTELTPAVIRRWLA